MKSKDRAFTHKLKDKLLTEMARQGLNGQRLAQRSRVSDSEISRILSGQSTPGLENAFRLARSVGVSLDYLADDALDCDPLKASDPLTPDERRLLDLAQQIGMSRTILLLENIRYVGYELAMQRLLMAKPVVELDLDDDHRSVAPTQNGVGLGVMPASRSNTG
jgi:transcriptional regulator with XRE-family HTH domain